MCKVLGVVLLEIIEEVGLVEIFFLEVFDLEIKIGVLLVKGRRVVDFDKIVRV